MSYDAEQANLKLLKRTYAERTKRTIFFLGAGASSESGMPTWHDLREAVHQAIDAVVEEGSDDDILEIFRELEILREEDDYWKYFEYAEKNWETTYSDALDSVLDLDYKYVPVPVVYEKLWSMRNVRQLVTLNVDGLLENAFVNSSRTKSGKLLSYDGFNITDSQTFIAKDSYCVLNLHGTVYQKSRWVMSGAERRRLIEGASGRQYRAFLTWLFQSHNIVFVGVNPTDVAVSPAIQEAKASGILGSHFWISPSPTVATRRWAEKQGVRIISYSPEKLIDGSETHSSTICSILDDIEQYVASEPEVHLPNKRSEIDPDELPKSEELVALVNSDRLQAIEMLSGAAVHIGEKHGFRSAQMNAFMRRNSLAIQISTALDSRIPSHNSLGKYRLREKIQGGGSSAVWQCEDSERPGLYFIIKILNGSTHEDETERQSFRRGIESMYLLNGTNSSIAPKYIDHYELPLAVVMEQINGSSLSEVFSFESITQPLDILKLFMAICESIKACHTSEAQVLHRDLKPGNIIFENWFVGYERSDLLGSRARLINFDLSWHRYSSGNTKAISAEESGYYAPEQKKGLGIRRRLGLRLLTHI